MYGTWLELNWFNRWITQNGLLQMLGNDGFEAVEWGARCCTCGCGNGYGRA